MVNELLASLKSFREVRPSVICADGFTFNIGASLLHYCEPQDSDGPYTSVEIGWLSQPEPLLLDYADDATEPIKTLYPFVPVDIVAEVIRKHGGLKK